MSESEPRDRSDPPLPGGLRPRRVWLWLGALGLVALFVGSFALLAWPHRPAYSGAFAMPKAQDVSAFETDVVAHEEASPESARRRRVHLDEEGAMGGLLKDTPAEREREAKRAAASGIIGLLSRPPAAQRPNLAMPKSANPAALEPQDDPTGQLGGLMGDSVDSRFGFGGFGMGRGKGVGTIGTIGARGHGYGAGAGSVAVAGAEAGAETVTDADAVTGTGTGTVAGTETGAGAGAAAGTGEAGLVASRAWLAKLRRRRPSTSGASLRASVRAPRLVGGRDASARPAPTPESSARLAAAWLARYAAVDDVPTRSAHGYWQNTYLPADPSLRALSARLERVDRARLLPEALQGAPLDTAVARNPRPFDPPSHGALSIFVEASERGTRGPRRLMVQVGLQATPRYSGRRPALNLALVVDLREPLDVAQSARLRALLAEFARARDSRDRFSLHVAGPGGGLLVAPESFQSGPVSVALQRALAAKGATTLSLLGAVQAATEPLQRADDPGAPLGSSSLILITARPPAPADAAALTAQLRDNALDGISAAVFGIGDESSAHALSALALSGQGALRLLGPNDDAAALVDRELSSVARVVARALRLRLRLAAGVQLVDVLGSRPLDELLARQLRDTEQHIDQRVSRNLGIAADRGDDEEGIQMLIPAFYAGDSHVVLLDVLVPGPGPVLDVTVRYKDLIELDNGVARASLSLENRELARGPLQQQVLASLLGHELSTRLAQAAELLARQQAPLALTILSGLSALLADARARWPGLLRDREFARDQRLVDDYVRLARAVDTDEQRHFLRDSLRFASLMKVQPRPAHDRPGVRP